MIVHNFPTPYRMPLFERLGTLWRLEVWFCSPRDQARNWSPGATDILGATTRVLPRFMLRSMIINYTIPFDAARSRADVVILSEDPATIFTTLGVATICRLRKIPFLLWTEHVLASRALPGQLGPLAFLRHLIYTAIRRLLVTHSAAVLCMSGMASVRELSSLTSRLPPTFTGTQVMPSALLPSRLQRTVRARTGLLFLGYFRPEKDITTLVEAFTDVASSTDVLTIAGDGPLRNDLANLVRGTPNLHLLDYVTGEDKASLIEGATALVLPSVYEPWGLVVNESLYFGTPVIACEGVGASELVEHEVNGLLFQWDTDGAGLRAVLRRFLRDANLRERLAAGARATPTDLLSAVSRGTQHIENAVRSLDTPGSRPANQTSRRFRNRPTQRVP